VASGNSFSATLHLHVDEVPLEFGDPVPHQGAFTMLAKCANPSCSTPLVYLREGKIFMVESPELPANVDGATSIKAPNRVEHFWLCGPCSSELTLSYDRQSGVRVIRKIASKTPHTLRAAAS
jgi:hypothetical protein